MTNRKKGFSLYSNGEPFKPSQVWRTDLGAVPKLLQQGGSVLDEVTQIINNVALGKGGNVPCIDKRL